MLVLRSPTHHHDAFDLPKLRLPDEPLFSDKPLVSSALRRKLYGLMPLLLMIAVIVFVVLDNH